MSKVDLNQTNNMNNNNNDDDNHNHKPLATQVSRISKTLREIPPVRIAFERLRFTITNKDGSERILLNNISGEVLPGTILAVMGPTGSGKTSLINVLAQRMKATKKSKLTGEITINGQPVNRRSFARISAYVLQDDALFACLTVEETLMMAAHFQLPSSDSRQRKHDFVNDVITELGLIKARNTIIGDSRVRGVSGGERKRVNIGVELIKNPCVVFLDEPTSGLDSFQAQSVMSALKELSNDGRTVIASIHQPRSSIFHLFDKLLLLSDGRVIFSGPAQSAVEYFSSQGHPCPAMYNPADFFLDLISHDVRSPEQDVASRKRIDILAEAWVSGTQAKLLEENTKSKTTYSKEGEVAPEVTGYLSSWFRQFYLCAWRSFVNVKRNKGANIIKVVISVFFALLLGAIYSNTGYNQKNIQDRIGVLFFFAINQTFGPFTMVLGTFANDKAVIERERAGKAYHVSAFYLGKFVAEVPFNTIGPVIFGVIVYWIVGLNSGAENFVIFLLLLIQTCFCAIAFGMIVSALAPNVEAANAIGPLLVIIFILFGGFYINVESLPKGAQWVQNLSLIRFAFEGLAVNEFKGVTFSCEDVADNGVCIRTGEEVLARLSFDRSATHVLWLQTIYFCVEHVIAYIILRFKRPKYLTL